MMEVCSSYDTRNIHVHNDCYRCFDDKSTFSLYEEHFASNSPRSVKAPLEDYKLRRDADYFHVAVPQVMRLEADDVKPNPSPSDQAYKSRHLT